MHGQTGTPCRRRFALRREHALRPRRLTALRPSQVQQNFTLENLHRFTSVASVTLTGPDGDVALPEGNATTPMQLRGVSPDTLILIGKTAWAV